MNPAIIIAILILLIPSIILGYVFKGKSRIKKKWDALMSILEWLPLFMIVVGFFIILFFKDEFFAFFITNEWVVAFTVLGLLIIGFPALTIISFGLWIGDMLERFTNPKKSRRK